VLARFFDCVQDDSYAHDETHVLIVGLSHPPCAVLQRKKPDMIAYKELREELTPQLAHGHLPGIPPGFEVFGRGELAILGLHTQIVRGIDARADVEGAYAIVMSGGYKDDDDEGAELWYTGEGGQKDGKQVRATSLRGRQQGLMGVALRAGGGAKRRRYMIKRMK
jgi:hypothetical protein